MKIIKEGLYQLLEPIGVMPEGLFIRLVKKVGLKGFNIISGETENNYTYEPLKFIKDL